MPAQNHCENNLFRIGRNNFICDGIRVASGWVGGCPVHVGRNNYVPLFGVDTDLRY